MPRYQCVQETFFQPNLYRKGDILETDAAPGPHFAPLNKAAREALEAWYNEPVTYTEYDKETGEAKATHTIYPHRKFKLPETSEAGEPAKARVLKRATNPNNDPEHSLGFSFLKPDTDPRVPAAHNSGLDEEYLEEDDDGPTVVPVKVSPPKVART
jgi:hypothetical protein